MYTSGTTTGRPKAVQMAREMLLTSIDYEEMFGCNSNDRAIFVTPLFHGNGSGGLTCCLRYGGSSVFQRRFSASTLWSLVDRTRPSLLFTLAPIVIFVPARDLLLITGSEDKEGLRRAREIVNDNEWPYLISLHGFVRENDSWARFDY